MTIRHAIAAMAVMTIPAAAEPINPAVTPETIRQTICVAGWTDTIRPPVSYTARIKIAKMRARNIPASDARLYKLDHIIPLVLGGAARDPENLQVQPISEARGKDRLEKCLRRAVCKGQVGLDEARKAIWTNWRSAGCPMRQPYL